MRKRCQRLWRALFVACCAALPVSLVECDLDDGELVIDLEELGIHLDGDEIFIDLWYEDCGHGW